MILLEKGVPESYLDECLELHPSKSGLLIYSIFDRVRVWPMWGGHQQREELEAIYSATATTINEDC